MDFFFSSSLGKTPKWTVHMNVAKYWCCNVHFFLFGLHLFHRNFKMLNTFLQKTTNFISILCHSACASHCRASRIFIPTKHSTSYRVAAAVLFFDSKKKKLTENRTSTVWFKYSIVHHVTECISHSYYYYRLRLVLRPPNSFDGHQETNELLKRMLPLFRWILRWKRKHYCIVFCAFIFLFSLSTSFILWCNRFKETLRLKIERYSITHQNKSKHLVQRNSWSIFQALSKNRKLKEAKRLADCWFNVRCIACGDRSTTDLSST